MPPIYICIVCVYRYGNVMRDQNRHLLWCMGHLICPSILCTYTYAPAWSFVDGRDHHRPVGFSPLQWVVGLQVQQLHRQHHLQQHQPPFLVAKEDDDDDSYVLYQWPIGYEILMRGHRPIHGGWRGRRKRRRRREKRSRKSDIGRASPFRVCLPLPIYLHCRGRSRPQSESHHQVVAWYKLSNHPWAGRFFVQ